MSAPARVRLAAGRASALQPVLVVLLLVLAAALGWSAGGR